MTLHGLAYLAGQLFAATLLVLLLVGLVVAVVRPVPPESEDDHDARQ